MHRPLDTHTHTHTKRSTIFAPMFYHFVRFGPAVGDSVFFFLNSCVDNSSHAHTRRCLCMALFFFIIPCLDILEKKTQIGQGERYDVSRRIRCRYLFSFGWLFSCWQILFFSSFLVEIVLYVDSWWFHYFPQFLSGREKTIFLYYYYYHCYYYHYLLVLLLA